MVARGCEVSAIVTAPHVVGQMAPKERLQSRIYMKVGLELAVHRMENVVDMKGFLSCRSKLR